uniref:TetR/AcrR family transcriptional regulator n=1 Tax=Streptomyces blattellae TaxID=2569855 RepID=UPI0012B70A3A|nr:TetR/AcrR family transcriptional regulator [Streptomyces blattellae]
MPKVTEAHRVARRGEILDAAQRVFAAHGYRGSSITQIVKASGLSAGAVYSYYSSKEELFHAVVERTFATRTAAITQVRPDVPRPPGELLGSVIAELGEDIYTIAPQVWAEAAVEPEARAAVAGVFEQFGGLLRAELTEWAMSHPQRAGGDPAAWAARRVPVLVAIIPGFIMQRLTMPGFDQRAFLDALAETFDA